MHLTNLTDSEQEELFELLEQENRERVSPKMERFREPWRIKLAKGGRGAGAKSWSTASLLIQRAHREPLRIGCFREVQKTIEESSYQLLRETIERLRYPGWKITRESLDSPAGAHIIFRGLVDIRAANQVKGLEGFDIFFLDEASQISHDSIRMMLPTLRKAGSELWAVWNPETEFDPVYTRLWLADRDDVLMVDLEPGKIDNPFWTENLQLEMEADYRNNPDEAEHTWGGAPRKQGDNAVMSRVAVRAAMNRTAEETEPDEVGVDVARFGNDKTEMYRRRGFKTVAHKEFIKKDTQFIADAAWDFSGRSSQVPIKVDDTGLGGGVTDRLKRLGAKVIPVNFGGAPHDKEKYDTVADEMWFEFPVDEASIPDDPDLMTELSGRLFDYDKRGRRKVEPKDQFKKRFGRSPDKADALLLAYYVGYNHSALPKEYQDQMAARRKRTREARV
jgi:phage terminase large subunit